MRKYLGVAIACLFCFTNTTFAGDVSRYVEIIQNGQYELDFRIDYNVKNNGKIRRYLGEGIFAKNVNDKPLSYYDMNIKQPYEKYIYQYSRFRNIDGVGYYARRYAKQQFAIQEVVDKKYDPANDYDYSMLSYVNQEKIEYESEVFSTLGPIAEQAKLLPIYKTEYLQSGQEFHSGKSYQYDEYKIVEPYAAGLRLYYLEGVLKKCIKTLNDRQATHWLYDNATIKQDGYVVIDIDKFDSNVSEELYGGRIARKGLAEND